MGKLFKGGKTMNLKTTIKIAIKELLANKLRSILTMLGVIIGVFSIVTILSLGQGMTNYISENLFTNVDTISINIYSQDRSKLMNYEETMDFFNKEGVTFISPRLDSNNNIQYKKTKEIISVKGINHHFFTSVKMPLIEGRNISPVDVAKRTNSIVINDLAKEKFFPNESPIGKLIAVEGIEYKVVGLVESEKASMFNWVQEEMYMPITSFIKDINNGNISNITLGAESKEEVIGLSARITTDLDEYFATDLDKEDTEAAERGYNNHFYIANPEKELGELNKVMKILSIGLGGIAGISLLVGGIGIMNIMFVSVTERTKEIGIRKAIGAKRKSIVIQFLVEAAIVSGIGGIIGLLLAGGVSGIIGAFAPFKPEISVLVMILSVSFSAFIGIIFGIYPANKAAKLRPIDALRFE